MTLWVRETWACGTHMGQLATIPKELGDDMVVAYKENYHEGAPALKGIDWRPNIHMPRWACRLFLEVVGVRVERLQKISDSDAIQEGIPDYPDFKGDCPVDDFMELWDSINAKRGHDWKSNPWVWVVEFKVKEEGDADSN